ncbi:hypothetical protein V6N13_083484 [Hibiscus sabdariffa]
MEDMIEEHVSSEEVEGTSACGTQGTTRWCMMKTRHRLCFSMDIIFFLLVVACALLWVLSLDYYCRGFMTWSGVGWGLHSLRCFVDL